MSGRVAVRYRREPIMLMYSLWSTASPSSSGSSEAMELIGIDTRSPTPAMVLVAARHAASSPAHHETSKRESPNETKVKEKQNKTILNSNSNLTKSMTHHNQTKDLTTWFLRLWIPLPVSRTVTEVAELEEEA
jgi:hypothetical protein